MKKIDEKEDKKIEELRTHVEDWKSKALRALADYQNLERRVAKDRHDERTYAAEHILRELLPVVDVLTRAQDHLNDQGLALALKELWKVLGEQGIMKIDAVGKVFNPHEMECIEVVDGIENEVVEEAAPGFRFHDKVIRPVKVKVGKKLVAEVAKEPAKEVLQKGDLI